MPSQAGWRSAYLKVTTRAAVDWPTLGVAVSLKTEAHVVADVRIAVSAATDRPLRLAAAENVLRGAAPDAATLLRCGEAAAEEVQLAADARGSSAYKRELLRVYAARALRAALHG